MSWRVESGVLDEGDIHAGLEVLQDRFENHRTNQLAPVQDQHMTTGLFHKYPTILLHIADVIFILRLRRHLCLHLHLCMCVFFKNALRLLSY